MAILAECPSCRRRQSAKNKRCKCGENLDKAKRSNRVKYWITYRIPGGKQRREYVGYSVEEARDADGKRRGQKRDNNIFELLPESKMNFNELSGWYLGLPKVKQLADFSGCSIRINNFNKFYGEKKVKDIKQIDVERYQVERQHQGIKKITIDQEIRIIKTMINKAFDNDMISGRTLKAFRRTKFIASMADRARTRIISFEEYQALLENSAPHLMAMLIVAYNTGMRPGEVKQLQWKFIDRKTMFIRFPAEFTKEKKAKAIPINHHAEKVLKIVPRAIQHDYVFTYRGNPVRKKNSVNYAFEAACRRAGLPYGRRADNGIIFHDFRRTFKTNMLKAGIDKVYRDTLVGHSLKGMDAHYIIPSEGDLRRAMEKFTDWLDQTIPKQPNKRKTG